MSTPKHCNGGIFESLKGARKGRRGVFQQAGVFCEVRLYRILGSPLLRGKGRDITPSPLASTSLEWCGPLSELRRRTTAPRSSSVTPTVGCTGPNQGRLRELLLVSLRDACDDTFR